MNLKFSYRCWPDKDGHKVAYVQAEDGDYLPWIYRDMHLSYPKFFKMDDMTKVGFLAVERLMLDFEGSLDPKTTGVVFFSAEASLPTDRQFEETIKDDDDFFPSPSIFVYTLPNILCGEVCIRHGFQGESGLYVIYDLDKEVVMNICRDMLGNNSAVILGIVDEDKGKFWARAEVITKDYLSKNSENV